MNLHSEETKVNEKYLILSTLSTCYKNFEQKMEKSIETLIVDFTLSGMFLIDKKKNTLCVTDYVLHTHEFSLESKLLG